MMCNTCTVYVYPCIPRTQTHTHTCTHAHMHTHTRTHMHTRMHVRTHTPYTHTHTFMKHTSSFPCSHHFWRKILAWPLYGEGEEGDRGRGNHTLLLCCHLCAQLYVGLYGDGGRRGRRGTRPCYPSLRTCHALLYVEVIICS